MGRFKEMLIDMMNEDNIPHRMIELDEVNPVEASEAVWLMPSPPHYRFRQEFTNFLKEDIKETEINNKLNRENMLEWED
jgi:hypothetical protein